MMLSYECSFLQTKFLDLCFKKLNLSVIFVFLSLVFYFNIYTHTYIQAFDKTEKRRFSPTLSEKSLCC